MSAALILIIVASVNHEGNNTVTVDTFSKEELLQRHDQSERFRLTLKDRLAGEQNLAPALDEFIELESQMLVAGDDAVTMSFDQPTEEYRHLYK